MELKPTKTRAAYIVPHDTVTILWTAPGKVATKKFSKDSPESEIKVTQYDAGHLFTAFDPIGVYNIAELSTILKFVEQQQRALIIRGAPVSQCVINKPVHRIGSGEGANFKGNFRTPESGRYYMQVDIDKYVLPKNLKLTHSSIKTICEHLVHKLPAEFHDASYHWQLSSSAGVFDKTKVSIHLWFWLTSPVSDPNLKIWAKNVNEMAGITLVDPSLFQHVQAHYTAAPIFVGMNDPFPIRSGLINKERGSVDLQLPDSKVVVVPQKVGNKAANNANNASNRSNESGFENFLSKVGDHPGGEGFHAPLRNAAASYVAQNGRDNTDIKVLGALLRDCVLTANRSNHSNTEIKQRASDEHIVPLIKSAINKFGDSTLQRRKTRRIEGIQPHFYGEYQGVAEIQKSLRAILDQAF